MTSTTPFLSRDELLGGLPARRASVLMFAIESRTAWLAAHDRDAIAFQLSPKTAEEREQAFLELMASSRDAAQDAAHPAAAETCIQDLELYARDWQPLVPEDAALRAALAHLLGQKYSFTRGDVPSLNRALGLDTRAVEQAYQMLYDRPLSSVYTREVSGAERARWIWTGLVGSLEKLSPFWTAFLLTLPGQAGLLAMPIALSGIGLSTGMAILVIFGLINMLTAAALAEAVSRSATTRFGFGFLSQLANEYLGPAAASLISIILTVNNFFVLIVFFLGVAGTLQDVTHLPGVVWGALLFGVCLYFLYRRSFGATVGTTILIVIVNLLITISIPLLVLPHVKAANLAHLSLPFAGVSLQPVVWQLVLGTMLSMYYSHITIAAYAPVVLRRDPGAQSWIKGSVSAIFATLIIALLWIVVVNGAVSPDTLAKTAGTVITPLAALAGPLVGLLGSILVILSLGLSAIQIALVVYFVTNEILPARAARRLGNRARFLLAISPVIVVFIVTEWILLSGRGSFTSFLGTLSAISLPLMGGMLPVLLLASTRRKGEFSPSRVSNWLGSPPVVIALYAFFLDSIFLHSLVLWSEPVTKAVAFVVGVAIIATTLIMLRQGMLRPRLVIELRQDESGGPSLFSITASGRLAPALVCLEYANGEQEVQAATDVIPAFASLKSVSFQFAALPVAELKIWAHKFLPEGSSKGMPVTVSVLSGEGPGSPRSLEDGLGTLPLTGSPCRVLITMA